MNLYEDDLKVDKTPFLKSKRLSEENELFIAVRKHRQLLCFI